MFNIEKNKIYLTRGDNATMLVSIFDVNDIPYEIKATDTITFTIRATSGTSIVLLKVADSDHYIIINHADTVNISPGMYIYDTQIQTGDGYVYTINKGFFTLGNEVTY